MLNILSDTMMTATRMQHKPDPCKPLPPRQQRNCAEKRRRAWLALGGLRF